MSAVLTPDVWRSAPLRRLVHLRTERRAATANDKFVGLEHVESWSGKAIVENPPPGTGLAAFFRQGDVLFARLRPYLAKGFLAETDGLASTEFIVMKSRFLAPRFLRHVVLSTPFIQFAVAECFGAKMPRADWDSLGAYAVSYPESDVAQERLASFLDKVGESVAVARAQLKDASDLARERAIGIAANEISQIATASPLVELRRALHDIEQGWSPQADDRPAEGDEWAVLKLSAIKRGLFRSEEHKTLPEGVDSRPELQVRDGDLLLTRANTMETVGDACIVRDPPRHLMMSDLIYRLVPNLRKVDPDYLCLWLLSRHARQQIEADARGTSLSMVKVSQELVRRWRLPLPDLAIQRDMVRRVKTAQSAANGLINDARATADLLTKRQSALVTAALTGQLTPALRRATKEAL